MGTFTRLLKKCLKYFTVFTLIASTLVIVIGCASQLPKPMARSVSQQSLVISNVTVVDVVNERQLPNMDVQIENGTIVGIVPHSTRKPNSATKTIDASGKYLIPALWDMHVHTVSSSPQFHFPLYVANGVLNIRDMGDTCSWGSELSCKPFTESWRQSIDNGNVLGPNIQSVASYHIESISEEENATEEELIQQSKQLIQALNNRNDETIKIQLGHAVSDKVFATILSESQRLGLPVIGHLPGNLNILEHDLSNLKSIEHDRALYPYCSNFDGTFDEKISTVNSFVEGFDADKCNLHLQKLAADGVSYAPTHIASSFQDLMILNNEQNTMPGLDYTDSVTKSLWNTYAFATELGFSEEDGEALRKAYELSKTITQMAADNAVNILVGTDALDAFAVPGFSVHTELKLLVDAGLTPYQALQAASINSAHYFGLQDSTVSVSVGKSADMIVLNTNPIDNITSTADISAVVFSGRLYDEQALNDIKAYVEGNVGSFKASSVLLWNLISG